MSDPFTPLGAAAQAGPPQDREIGMLAKMFDAHVGLMEEELSNVKFARALKGGADESDTPMPFVRVFETEIVDLRARVTMLQQASAALSASRTDPPNSSLRMTALTVAGELETFHLNEVRLGRMTGHQQDSLKRRIAALREAVVTNAGTDPAVPSPPAQEQKCDKCCADLDGSQLTLCAPCGAPLLALSSPSVAPTAWLVELGCSPPKWWTGRGNEWTAHVDGTLTVRGTHPDSALRFARREDAERAIGWLVEKGPHAGCKATEHLWLSASSVSAAADLRKKTTEL